MNFRRNLYSIILALVGALTLSSCEFGGATSFERFEFIEETSDDHQDKSYGEGAIKYGEYADYIVRNANVDYNLGKQYEVFRDYGGSNNILSTGDQKLLVVPVDFSDYGVDKLGMSDAQFIESLNKAFFGSYKNNVYVSVSEYLNRSSYGKLRLSGMVTNEIYHFPLSVENIRNKKVKREVLANTYYEKVVEWFKENHPDLYDSYKVEGLPENANLPIYMVYTYPFVNEESEEENFFWAFTFSNVPLSWSSSSFMYLKYGEPDSHTFIHETGHLLGLLDYYPMNVENASNSSDKDQDEFVIPDPAGRIDMMDCSVGDETSFSKMYLNWTRPIYAYDNSVIAIDSFIESGDVILLANDWNKTIFDEYYLIEFYTPTGLNTYDVSYGNEQAKLPSVPGIKIYHVDARLAFVDGKKEPYSYCENGITIPRSNSLGFAHNNNTYKEPNDFQKNYLYSLVLNHEEGMVSGCATNQSLFRVGDEIPELSFNKGGSLNFKISIDSLGFSKAFIKIEKTA